MKRSINDKNARRMLRVLAAIAPLSCATLAIMLPTPPAARAQTSVPYALTPSQTQAKTSKLSDGTIQVKITLTFPTSGYTVNFPANVTQSQTDPTQYSVILSATKPTGFVSEVITTIEYTYNFGKLDPNTTYKFSINQVLNPTTLEIKTFTGKG